MADRNGVPSAPRPVFGGCFGLVIAAAALVAAGAFFLVFLDSGANTGRLVLRPAASYAEGTVEFVPERNLFVVRMGDGTFIALADLDATNRAAEGRRCRVHPIPGTDRELPGLLETYRGRMSAQAAGSQLLFQEDCFGAIYDATGLRLDADERNLDRYATSTNNDGRLVVDVSRRICTARAEGEQHAEVRCSE